MSDGKTRMELSWPADVRTWSAGERGQLTRVDRMWQSAVSQLTWVDAADEVRTCKNTATQRQ